MSASSRAALFGVRRALIGMVHLQPLPGTPRAAQGLDEITARAVQEAQLYRAAGYCALLIENMHDRPYLKGGVGPEIVATLASAWNSLTE